MNPIDILDDYPKERGPGEGDDLWDHVTRDVKPLRVSSRTVAPSASPHTKKTARGPDEPTAPVAVVRERLPGDREVDSRTGRKLKRGQYPIDITLDLHGLTQEAAHKKLRETIRRAYGRNLRCVLIITGKGRSAEGISTGVLKRQVPQWLAEHDLSDIVLRVEPAQAEHGGGGALYVLLRRKRTISN